MLALAVKTGFAKQQPQFKIRTNLYAARIKSPFQHSWPFVYYF